MSDITNILHITNQVEKINSKNLENAQEILSDLITDVNKFTYIKLEKVDAVYENHPAKDNLFVCKITVLGSHKLSFKSETEGKDFLVIVRAAAKEISEYLHKENNKRAQH
jgi:hypothetical protein